jgi:hypothetical protein
MNNYTPWAELEKMAEESGDNGNNMLDHCREKSKRRRWKNAEIILSENKAAKKSYKSKTFKRGETMIEAELKTEELRKETEKDKRILLQ